MMMYIGLFSTFYVKWYVFTNYWCVIMFSKWILCCLVSAALITPIMQGA